MKEYFNLLNSFFDHIYVITLRRATDRHQHIRQQLEGLKYQLFFGMDKQDLDVEELKRQGIYNEEVAIQRHRFHKPMVPGMIGCAWSHKLVYEDMYARGYQQVLVLEDDIVISKENIVKLPQILKELPESWELVYFRFDRYEKPTPLSFFKKAAYHAQRLLGTIKFSHTTINNLYPKRVSKHLLRAGYHDQIHAYGLTNTGAIKLTILQDPITFIADNLLAHAATNRLVEAYITEPKLIFQLSQNEKTMATSVGED